MGHHNCPFGQLCFFAQISTINERIIHSIQIFLFYFPVIEWRYRMSKFTLKNENGKIYTGWYIAAMGIILMTFAYSCIVSVSGMFMVPVTEALDLQIGDFSVWVTIMSVTAIIFLLIFSKIFSKRTIKPIMIVSCLCGVAGFIGFATSQSLIQFYLFSVLLGICFGGLTTTPSTLLVSNWFGTKMRGKALGILFGGNSIVVMLIMPVLNQIILKFGWRVAYFVLAGALLIICLPLVLKFAIWSPESVGQKRMGDAGEQETLSSDQLPGVTFKDGLKKPSTWLVFLSGTLLVIPSSAILVHSQPFMIMHGYSATFAANTTSIMIGICVVTCILVGFINDRFGLRAAALFSGVAFILDYIAQIYIPAGGMLMVVLFIVLYGLGCPAVNIVSPLFANHMFGEKEVGTFIGYINLFISIGGAIGSSFVGKLYDLTGTYILPFWICAGLLLVMTIIRFVFASKKYAFQGK